MNLRPLKRSKKVVLLTWENFKPFKGPVNIYGNTGPGNLQRDRRLFWPSVRTGPPIILRVGSTGPRIISMLFFNGAKDYFGALRYGTIDYIETLWVFLIIKIRGHEKFILRGQQLFRMKISTGPRIILDYSDTGPHIIFRGSFNGATDYFGHVHRSFPGPVFPYILIGP